MKATLSYPSKLTVVILATAVLIAVTAKSLSSASSFFFEITLQSSAQGYAQLFYHIGSGFRETDSAVVLIAKSKEPVLHRFRIPTGDYQALRFDPIDREATVVFSVARIVDSRGKAIKIFSPSQFQATQQISSLKIDAGSVQLTTVAGANDPILEISLPAPFSLKRAAPLRLWGEIGLDFFGIFVPCWGLFWLVKMFYLRRRKNVISVWKQLLVWMTDYSKSSIAAMAICAVILSCYPVVFFGKSFVSPNNGTLLLYDDFPTLPGYEDTAREDVKGADIGAMMWGHIPYSVVQSRAIFNDFELPLWNRYNSNGVTLIGQGQSMLGDPLHLLVILAGGTSWAWDVKYLLAKTLFATGLGLIVYATTKHLPSALLLTFSSTFIGFFPYRFNHPAFFSLCYAPWILYCWLRILQAPTTKTFLLWCSGLILANWAVMNSGTVKEAYLLLLAMNLCGLLLLFFSRMEKRLKMRMLLALAWAELLFVLISTPLWFTFLDALQQSYTSYDVPGVQQTPFSLFIGIFDDIFYRQLMDGEAHFNPSANFLILLGFLWSLTRIKKLLSNRTYLAVGLSALLPFSFVFGLVPASLIVKVPFLANVSHVNNTFSCVLIIHLIVIAGFGLQAFWENVASQQWKTDLLITVILFGTLLVFYFCFTQSVHKSAFFYGYGGLLVCAFVVLPCITKHALLRRAVTPALALLLLLCLLIIHWRYGMHLRTGVDDYVMNPQVRINLQTKSPAIEFIKSKTVEPFRAVGFGDTLFPGYHAVLGVESMSGPDALMNPYHRELCELFRVERGWDWRYIIREKHLPELKPFYDFLNIRYYLAPHTDQPKELPGLTFTSSMDLNVYCSESAWPRAFFTNALSLYETPSEFARLVREGDGHPFAAIQTTDITHNNPAFTGLSRDYQQRQVVFATDYTLTNNTTSFTIIAPGKGVIVLTEAYMDKDFRVTVNGKATSYFRINYVFKGIAVKHPGTFHVTVSYWPHYFTVSLWIAGLGVALLIAWFFGAGRKSAYLTVPRQ